MKPITSGERKLIRKSVVIIRCMFQSLGGASKYATVFRSVANGVMYFICRIDPTDKVVPLKTYRLVSNGRKFSLSINAAFDFCFA